MAVTKGRSGGPKKPDNLQWLVDAYMKNLQVDNPTFDLSKGAMKVDPLQNATGPFSESDLNADKTPVTQKTVTTTADKPAQSGRYAFETKDITDKGNRSKLNTGD